MNTITPILITVTVFQRISLVTVLLVRSRDEAITMDYIQMAMSGGCIGPGVYMSTDMDGDVVCGRT